jgi:cephalosporin-C deacetylase
MPLFDLSMPELREYRPPRDEPADFDTFWSETLSKSRAAAFEPVFSELETALRTVAVFDVTFSGYMGQPVRGWLLVPKVGQQPLPAVIQYIGYGGGRAFPFNHLLWASLGYASLVMDTRGQGGTWSPGDTPDLDDEGSGPQHPGFLTRGIWDRHSYYYRRLISDAVRAVEVMLRHPLVDPKRVVVCGASQGGGLALAVAGLSDQICAALIDVPFLCHYRRAVEITDERPYSELTKFLSVHQTRAEEAFRTLSYFDGMNFAARAKAPGLFSVGLMDIICPPSTVFAAYNYYGGEREIKVWPFNGHEAGEHNQRLEQFTFLERLGVYPKD